MKSEKDFPSGFLSYQTTYFHIVEQIINMHNDEDKDTFGDINYLFGKIGYTGFYLLADQVTKEFELNHIDNKFHKKFNRTNSFYKAVEVFVKKTICNENYMREFNYKTIF